MKCTSCLINGVGKCDPDGCPVEYGSWKMSSVYNNITKMCKMCQEEIGDDYDYGYDLHCTSCSDNGGGKCDDDGCPESTDIGIAFNNTSKMCEKCQTDIGGNEYLDCRTYLINGAGKCDPGGCPTEYGTWKTSSVYNNVTKLCEMCQVRVGDEYLSNCLSCSVNGAGKCDANGCPESKNIEIVYNSTSKMCETCQAKIGGYDNLHCK